MLGLGLGCDKHDRPSILDWVGGNELLDIKSTKFSIKNFHFSLSPSTKQTFKNPQGTNVNSMDLENLASKDCLNLGNNICFCTIAIICYFRLHLY